MPVKIKAKIYLSFCSEARIEIDSLHECIDFSPKLLEKNLRS